MKKTFTIIIILVITFLVVGCNSKVIKQDEVAEVTSTCYKSGEGAANSGKCCEGLVRIDACSLMKTEDKCVCFDHIGPCSNCGNNICEDWENVCNCPADCK